MGEQEPGSQLLRQPRGLSIKDINVVEVVIGGLQSGRIRPALQASLGRDQSFGAAGRGGENLPHTLALGWSSLVPR